MIAVLSPYSCMQLTAGRRFCYIQPRPSALTETIAPVQTTDSQVHTVITGTLSREIPLNGPNPLHPELPFVELAGFHDEPHALESCDIRQGIAVDRDEIRFKPRRDGADQVL